MSAAPEVSVIIPTHDRADFVGHAIQSALDQVGVSLEVIVVDDASRDGTAEVLAKFDDAIRVRRFERNVERGAARNAGAMMARAPVLAFLDSDDEWLPGKLQAQLPHVEAGRPCVTGGVLDDADRPRRYAIPDKAWDRVYWTNSYIGSASSLAIPAELFHTVGGYPEERRVQGSEDWLLLVRLHAHGAQPVAIPEPYVKIRIHESNSTGDPDAVARSQWAAVTWSARKGLVGGPLLREARAATAVRIARKYANQGRLYRASAWIVRATRAQRAIAARGVAWVILSASRGALRRLGI